MSVAFGFLVSIIISRMLGPEGRGIYSLAMLFSGVLVTFTNMGINAATVYYTAKNKYPSKEVFGNNLTLASAISVFTMAIGLIGIIFFRDNFFPGVGSEYLFLSLCSVPFSVNFEFLSHILVGLQKLTVYNSIILLQSFLFLTSLGIFVIGLDFCIKGALASQILSFLIAGLVLCYVLYRKTQGIIFKPNKAYLRDVLHYGFRSHLGSLVSFLHYRVDLFLINIFLNPVAVGFYSVAVTLAEGMLLISRSIGTALFPRLASEADSESLRTLTALICRNVLFVASTIAVLLCLLSNWLIVMFYSRTFVESIQPFRILLIGVVAMSGHGILVYYLMATGRPILVSYVTAVSVVINAILNVVWIPCRGIVGAAWSSTISYSIAFIISLALYAKLSGSSPKDVIFPQRADLLLYVNLLSKLRNRVCSVLAR
jgi:O-antigen/teichoic acid export membrane protein